MKNPAFGGGAVSTDSAAMIIAGNKLFTEYVERLEKELAPQLASRPSATM